MCARSCCFPACGCSKCSFWIRNWAQSCSNRRLRKLLPLAIIFVWPPILYGHSLWSVQIFFSKFGAWNLRTTRRQILLIRKAVESVEEDLNEETMGHLLKAVCCSVGWIVKTARIQARSKRGAIAQQCTCTKEVARSLARAKFQLYTVQQASEAKLCRRRACLTHLSCWYCGITLCCVVSSYSHSLLHCTVSFQRCSLVPELFNVSDVYDSCLSSVASFLKCLFTWSQVVGCRWCGSLNLARMGFRVV